MRSMCASSSRWNTTISSMRLRNSGLKWLRTAFITMRLVGAAAEVARHDEHGVGEVDGAALAVGEAAVVEQLQQHVEHVGVRLLDLVEQHDRVRPAPHRLGELTALLVADVARRRADEARHGVLLHVLRHVDADHRPLVVEQEVGERARQLGLADAGGAEEQERADRPVGVGEPGARPADGVRDRARPRRPGRSPARAARPPCARASLISPSMSRLTGMPVHLATISATSSSSTSSFSICCSDWSSSRRWVFAAISASSSRMVP